MINRSALNFVRSFWQALILERRYLPIFRSFFNEGFVCVRMALVSLPFVRSYFVSIFMMWWVYSWSNAIFPYQFAPLAQFIFVSWLCPGQPVGRYVLCIASASAPAVFLPTWQVCTRNTVCIVILLAGLRLVKGPQPTPSYQIFCKNYV